MSGTTATHPYTTADLLHILPRAVQVGDLIAYRGAPGSDRWVAHQRVNYIRESFDGAPVYYMELSGGGHLHQPHNMAMWVRRP